MAPPDHVPSVIPRIPARTGASFGLVALAAWASLYGVAASSYAGYDPRVNFLSDLGHPLAPNAWAFNAACILAGLLYVPYSLSVGHVLGGRAGLAGSALLLAANGFLVLVGVFPEESPNNLHFIASAAFFLLLTLSAGVLALPLHASRAFGPGSGILAGAVVAGGVVLVASRVDPLWEHVAVGLGLTWSLWNAGRLLRLAAG